MQDDHTINADETINQLVVCFGGLSFPRIGLIEENDDDAEDSKCYKIDE
jgi:hypothetical protein